MTQTVRTRSLFDDALATGALTTIATGGALLGLGLRDGEPSRLFRLVGRALLERIGIPSLNAPLTSVALGYTHHLAVATVWGAVLGLLVLLPKGRARLVAVPVAVILYAAAALWLLPPILRIGYAVTSNVSAVVPISVALLVALYGGIWVGTPDASTW